MIDAKYLSHQEGVVEDVSDNSEHDITGLAVVASNQRFYATGCVVSNMHATQATRVNIVDGVGGATKIPVPASANGGGAVLNFFDNPVVFSTGKTPRMKCVTAGATVTVFLIGYIRVA